MEEHKLLEKNFKSLIEGDRLGHAYLFHGADRMGAKNFALGFANYLETQNFELGQTRILSDMLLVEPNENQTIGIEEARKIKEFLVVRPNVSLRRTVVIDRAEFLTTEAQNALLKITEEPPESALLLLVTRDPELLKETLVSRFNKVFFAGQEKLDETMKYLEEGKKFLKTSLASRKDFLKELLEPEDFDILAFLDAVIFNLASDKEMDYNLWHKVLKLRQDFANFPLNPKLQFLNL